MKQVSGRFKSAKAVTVMAAFTLVSGMVPLARAEEPALNNKAFSFFGAGYEFIQYKETVPVPFGAEDIELSVDFGNPVQRSGGYIPFREKHGLYIVSSATLKPNTAAETWSYPGLGPIQTDDAKFSWYELDVAAAYHLKPGHHVTVGADYYTLNFTRFNFQSASGTDAFNTDVATVATGGRTIDQWVAAGNDARTYPGLRPENNLSTVIENVSSLALMVGYRYDSFFSNPQSPWRFAGGVRAGLPLYYQVENTQTPGVEFASYLDSGYDLGADASLAWNFHHNFSVIGRVDCNYKKRNSVSVGTMSVPENDVLSVQSTLGLNWAF
ncbi:MAG: hypothetical protein A2075_16025 [Geobacteraceae bacterium GWC2_58_44]|nr:MAG: hypothetical protein A2075_16025 [Geobacteraceae bacterium GWC2_58_44]HBG04178.1 hypothetical protein [Geobacter sp.]